MKRLNLKPIASGLFLIVIFGMLGCSSVETRQLDKKEFVLTDFYDEPPRKLESRSILAKADEVCPEGFDVLSKQASKSAEFGYDDASCLGSKNCRFELEWRIHCVKKNKPEASIFGKK